MAFRLIDPSDKLDYTEDFVAWLDTGVVIDGTPVWTIFPTGPTLGDQTNTTTSASIYVSGTTLGVTYELTVAIVTDAAVPQNHQRSITLSCEER